MRPGRHPWATNDLWTVGPDIGAANKIQPPAANQQEGYYRTRRPGPDLLNWQLNRGGLTYETLARLQGMNYDARITDGTVHGAGGTLLTGCWAPTTAASRGNWYHMFFYDAGGAVSELIGLNGIAWSVPACSPVAAPPFAGGGTADCDTDHLVALCRRIVTVNDGALLDRVYYATGLGGGAWGGITWVAGAPGLRWNAVGCDKNTAGGAAARWCIGDDASGGPSVMWDSPDGVNFSAQAGWPGATVVEPIRGIFHTCHPVDALGPVDPGNPYWLALSDTYATRSINGAAWTAAAHGLNLGGGAFNSKSAAYSRTAERWVAVIPDTQFGDIAYSDDNGATWVTLAGVLPGASAGAGRAPTIAGDGYGTFIVMCGEGFNYDSFWISVDEGMTWSVVCGIFNTPGGPVQSFPLVAHETVYLHNEYPRFPTEFLLAQYDNTVPGLDTYRSLKI